MNTLKVEGCYPAASFRVFAQGTFAIITATVILYIVVAAIVEISTN